MVCEVADRGPGWRTARGQPEPADGGRTGRLGLWLAGELTDTIEIDTGAEGTTVRISARGS